MRLPGRISAFVAAVAAVFLLHSCSGLDVEFPPEQPDGYIALLNIYNSGEEYCSFKSLELTTLLTFESRTLSVKHTEMEVHDCTSGGCPPVCVDDSGRYWLISGENSWIGYHEGLPNESAQPVYVYVDEETLHMLISNGNRIDFDKIDESLIPEKFMMPTVRITHSGSIKKDTYVEGNVTISDPDRHYSQEMSFSLPMKIKGRGNSTWGMPKKPYRIKLSEKKEVLGMAANKDWVLLANYADKSLMRNTAAMKVSRILEFPWTPASRQVEVYINNSYCGVYDLFEHKEVAKEKVNIGKEDYYLEIEQTIDEPNYFWTSKGVPIQIKYPEELTSEQKEYVKKYFKDFESTLYGSNFKNATTGYATYIDVDSFIDNFIIEELSKDIDGNVRKSSFLTLEKGGKLKFYHQWDFDLAFGNADYFPDGNNGPTGWWIKDYGTSSTKGNGWYYRLFQDPTFVKKVQKRWDEVYPQLKKVPDFIEKSVTEMGDAPTRNFKKWNILGTYVWPNVKVTGSYAGEVAYLENFYKERLEWIDTNIDKL